MAGPGNTGELCGVVAGSPVATRDHEGAGTVRVVTSGTPRRRDAIGIFRQIECFAGIPSGSPHLVDRSAPKSVVNRSIIASPFARLALLGAALVLSASACKETTSALPAVVKSVAIAPDSFNLIVNGLQQLIVSPLDSKGNVISDGRKVSYASSDITTASVSLNGQVIALRAGAANITATVDNVVGTAKVIVVRDPVRGLRLTPAGNQTAVAGDVLSFTAEPLDALGSVMTDRQVFWTTSSSSVATVSAPGLGQKATITTIVPGTVTVTATSEGVGAQFVLVVNPPTVVNTIVITPAGAQILRIGGTLALTAVPLDVNQQPIPGRAQTWTSSFPQVASVNATTGLVTAIQPGNTVIAVSIDGKIQTTNLTVTLVPLKSVTLTPRTFSIFETNTQQIQAVFTDSTGAVTTQIGRNVLWQSSDQTVAAVNQSGVVGGILAGTSSISVTAVTPGVNDQQTDSSVATIKRANTASVVINQQNITIAVGTGVSISASPLDSLGRPLPNRPVTYASSDTSVFTVQQGQTSQGATLAQLFGVKVGTATITATNEGKSTTATVTVK